jgi:hypothetical protein
VTVIHAGTGTNSHTGLVNNGSNSSASSGVLISHANNNSNNTPLNLQVTKSNAAPAVSSAPFSGQAAYSIISLVQTTDPAAQQQQQQQVRTVQENYPAIRSTPLYYLIPSKNLLEPPTTVGSSAARGGGNGNNGTSEESNHGNAEDGRPHVIKIGTQPTRGAMNRDVSPHPPSPSASSSGNGNWWPLQNASRNGLSTGSVRVGAGSSAFQSVTAAEKCGDHDAASSQRPNEETLSGNNISNNHNSSVAASSTTATGEVRSCLSLLFSCSFPPFAALCALLSLPLFEFSFCPLVLLFPAGYCCLGVAWLRRLGSIRHPGRI